MSFAYKTYLASREWALKREAVRRRSGNKCERCKKGPQDAVHHLTYANVGNEPLENLQAICRPCHEFLSGKSDYDPIYLDEYEQFCMEQPSYEPPQLAFNYCRMHCDTCNREKTFILKDTNRWGCPPEDLHNYNPSRDTFWLHPKEAYCDGCGKDWEGNGFVKVVRL